VFIPALGPIQPSIQCALRALSPVVKRSLREADHSPPCMTEIKNDGAIPPLFHKSSWHIANLIKYRDNFTLPIYRIGFLKLYILFNLGTKFFLTFKCRTKRSRNSAVGIATGYGLDD
jgi:hypothetical protein